MTKGKQIMKSTTGSMTPQATRFAVFALAVTAVLCMPVTAQSVDSSKADLDAAINRSAPQHPAAAAKPAAKPAAPARNNTAARPAAAARPNASKPAEANRSAAARPNAARPEAARNTARPNAARPEAARNTAHSNSGHESRPEARHEAAGRDNHGARAGEHTARAGEHGAKGAEHRGAEHGHPAARNAAYSHGGHAENLHGGKRIPEDRFRGSFGRDHQFHIGNPVMIGGQASFQFGGFWFGLVDPWPAAWLYTDAVFVDLVEGEYVLVNVAHPEVTVAVSAGDPVPATCAAEAAVPVAPVVAAPVVAAPVVVVPTYRYFTWHYWRHYWY